YQVPTDGKATVFYATKQNHVLCLARDAAKMLYAGTDKGGLVYRINPKGKGFILYSAAQPEVRSLLVTAKGIYAGTSSPHGKHKSQAVVSSQGSFAPLKNGEIVPIGGKKDSPDKAIKAVKASDDGGGDSEESEPDKNKGAPSGAGPGAGENSLY